MINILDMHKKMTVGELKKALDKFPDDAEVYICLLGEGRASEICLEEDYGKVCIEGVGN